MDIIQKLAISIILVIILYFLSCLAYHQLRYHHCNHNSIIIKIKRKFDQLEQFESLSYRHPQELFNTADRIWKDLPEGYVLYNPPSEMDLGIEELIEVRVSKELSKNLYKSFKRKGEHQIENIKVSPKMKAHLDGANAFDIKKRFDDPTMAIVGDYTQWEWDVTPLKGGVQKLNLYITGIIEIVGYSDRVFSYPALEREIKVKVNYKYKTKKFYENHWQFIIITIISILGLIIAYLKS